MERVNTELPARPLRRLSVVGALLLGALLGILLLALILGGITNRPANPVWLAVGGGVGAAVGLAVLVIISGGKDVRERLDQLVKLISTGATIALFFVGLQINNTIRDTEAKRAEADAIDKSYLAYLDGIANLLIEKKLGPELIATEDVRYKKNVADSLHARTQAILDKLDCAHKVRLVRFLNESGFLFEGSDKSQSSPYAGLLESTDLSDCDLSAVHLPGVDLTGAILVNATLDGATLTNSKLNTANLARARFRGAILSKADLTGADLTDADLTDADLTRAIMTGAKVKEEQWKKAKSIKGATLPDGTIGQ